MPKRILVLAGVSVLWAVGAAAQSVPAATPTMPAWDGGFSLGLLNSSVKDEGGNVVFTAYEHHAETRVDVGRYEAPPDE